MKNYIRDWKKIVAFYEGKRFIFDAQIELGEKGGYYGYLINNGHSYYVGWSSWFVRKGLPLVQHQNGDVLKDTASRELAKICILMYEDRMNEEKSISPCPAKMMTEEERQDAVIKAAEREAQEHANYSSSKEYKSGVPYHFYKAKTRVLCAKHSIKVATHIKRTYFADERIQEMYKRYRHTCMNCSDRAVCNAVCHDFESQDREYLMRYIASMVDSEEVQAFENIMMNRRGA